MDSSPLLPMCRGTNLVAFKVAARDLFGEMGLSAIAARLPAETHARTMNAPVLASVMYPETDVLAWFEAVFAGPANGDIATFERWVTRFIDVGFGSVRRLLLALITPASLAEKAAGLWRYDHTTGEMRTVQIDAHTAKVTLIGHDYGRTPLARVAFGEILRSAIACTRVTNVTKSIEVINDVDVVVTLTWH